MILEIRKENDPILSKKCSKVREVDSIRNLIEEMKETLAFTQGVGLAASQVGELKRVIVVHFPGEEESFALINPKIIHKSFKKNKEKEGCLSFPGIFLEIKRAERIKIKGIKENGKKVVLSLTGLPARIIQHEIDHLNGVVFLKRISIFERMGWN